MLARGNDKEELAGGGSVVVAVGKAGADASAVGSSSCLVPLTCARSGTG